MATKYEENPSMFRNRPLLFILFVILIAAYGLGLILLLIWWISTWSTKLMIEDDDVLFRKGLLSITRSEVSIERIRTVRIHQSLFNRLMNVGTIEIFTAGDHPEFIAKGMPDPNRVRALIMDRDQTSGDK